MTPDQPLPADDDADDTIADAFAAELEARALRDPALCRLVLRALQGRKPAAQMTQDELAAEWGTDRHTLNRVARKALRKLRFSPEVRSLKPQS